MNATQPPKTLELTDQFRAAYQLCRNGKLKEIRYNDGHPSFVIEGDDAIIKDDMEFRTGKGFVYPLSLKESYLMLDDFLKLKTQDDEEIDLLSDLDENVDSDLLASAEKQLSGNSQ